MSDSATPVPDRDPTSGDPQPNEVGPGESQPGESQPGESEIGDAERGVPGIVEARFVKPEGEASSTDTAVVREGSPFRVDPVVDSEGAGSPFAETGERGVEAFYDIGPARYMALGAVVAACVVLAFAVLSLIWFPGGGVLVSGLGCVLGILGLFSPRPKSAGGLLLSHIGLFVASYYKMVAS